MSIVSSTAVNDPTLRWFREAKFGMFIHFGLYAVLGRGEWVQYAENIPRGEYEKLMRRFRLSRFDADEWVDVAESAGCRYITLTAKHHDGFCLFGSSLTDYNITNTPFKRDLVAELAAACRRRGMRICLYYSQPDWHHPNFVHLPGAFKDLAHPPPDQRPDWARYLRYYHGQVMELCTRYGQIDGIWFDGSHKSEQTWRGRKIYRLIKQRQPGAIVNERAGYGDMFTPERSLPNDLTGYLFEACQSVSRKSWGYCPEGAHFSLPNLVENLVRVAGKGGNFLLNVGPMPDGRIPEAQTSRMAAVGRWLSVHGEAVYGSEAARIDTGSKDIVAARKGDALYLFLCRWPDGDRLTIPGVRTLPASAELLAASVPLTMRRTAAGLDFVGLPMCGPDPVLNVIRLSFAARPALVVVRTPLPRPKLVRVKDQGRTVLSVADSGVSGFAPKGGRLYIAPRPSKNPVVAVCKWTGADQRLTWLVDIPKAGSYRMGIRLSCPRPYDGSVFDIRSAQRAVTGKVKATATFDDYRWQSLGEMRFSQGPSRLRLQPRTMPYGYVFAHVAGLSLKAGRGN